MRLPRRSTPLVVALYVNAALLAGILVLLLTRSSAPGFINAAFAQDQPQIGGGGGLYIVPAQFSDHSFGCYIMDIDAQTICAYQYFERQLRLVAARSFRYDRRLTRFNSEKPSPDEVRQMLDQQQEDARVRERNTPNVDPETPRRNQ
jgi:hypothetical protein